MSEFQTRLADTMRRAYALISDRCSEDRFLDELLTPMAEKLGSPVEQLLAPCLIAHVECQENALGLLAHHVIGPFEPDFILTFYPHGADRSQENAFGVVERVLAIEVDGHEWHDRTKEQASRDRKRDRLLLRDYQVPTIRYTGSDVWADPMGYAEDAVTIAVRLCESLDAFASPPGVPA